MKKLFLFIIIILSYLQLNGQEANNYFAFPSVQQKDKICFALYTLHEGTLKMTAQFYPMERSEPFKASLEILRDTSWIKVDDADIVYPGYTAHFRVEDWDDSRDAAYRVNYNDKGFYEGQIRKNPVDKETITMAAFSCNSVYEQHGGDIARTDLVENIKKLDPDLLFFSGDQVYDHSKHYEYWLRFGEEFGEIIKDRPTICIPDDHDVGQDNIWGAAGKKSDRRTGSDGGYYMPVSYIQEVERAQTSHLPDPYDPTPVGRGIGVYYTDLNIGGVSFAIIEDRKWKTGPDGTVPNMGPRPDHVNTPSYIPEDLDVPGAVLLGDRQLQFLDTWAKDWEGTEMKAVLSQTIFCGGAHLHGQRSNRLYADLDANGWPQTGRNKALSTIRKAFAPMIAGDQHLATVIHHGVDDWNDAGYSFCVPAIANLYLRWWDPLEPGQNRIPGMPEYTGEFHDGFNNKITVWAVANPTEEENKDRLTTRAAGFGVIHFNKSSRKITFECWPRNVDLVKDNQYNGWPRTIHQLDNYGRPGTHFLPTYEFQSPDPVIQIFQEEDLIYALRIKGKEFQPKVFAPGVYNVRVIMSEGAINMEAQAFPENPARIMVNTTAEE